MLQLSAFLHNLGTFLHFQKDPILKDTFILKPNWGTAAVYKVLDNKRIQQQYGQFTHDDLTAIWSNPQYADLHHQLLQLMKNFKVCYEIPHREGNYIAPHLLSYQSPAYDWQDTPHNLILRYHYRGFMPKGILTRFIVEKHTQIENVSSPTAALVWKNGVILTTTLLGRPARAKITENQTRREIEIRVSGTSPRDFLSDIHKAFEDIHKTFERLEYETLIPCNCTQCKRSTTPYTYRLHELNTRLEKRKYDIECGTSYERVQVRNLIGDTIGEQSDDRDKFDRDPLMHFDPGFSYDRKRPEPSPPTEYHTHIHNYQGNTMTESSKTNNFNAPMSGIIGSDNAQVSHNTFNQTNSPAELLPLLTTLRQTSTTFPPATQTQIAPDLEILEAEIAKPDRNPTKIRNSLVAIVTAAGLIAGGVANVTDFSNAAIDLGQKFDIDIPALVGR